MQLTGDLHADDRAGLPRRQQLDGAGLVPGRAQGHLHRQQLPVQRRLVDHTPSGLTDGRWSSEDRGHGGLRWRRSWSVRRATPFCRPPVRGNVSVELALLAPILIARAPRRGGVRPAYTEQLNLGRMARAQLQYAVENLGAIDGAQTRSTTSPPPCANGDTVTSPRDAPAPASARPPAARPCATAPPCPK